MRIFDPRTAPEIITVRINSTTERSLKKAVKKLTRYFSTDNSMLSLLQIAEYHGYFTGVSGKYLYVIHEASDLSTASIEEPEFWHITLDSEPDEQIIQRIK
jgi:hypothetical protein